MGRKKDQSDQITKIWKFGGCIAKIKTLDVELKIVTDFEGVKCNFLTKNKKSDLLVKF